MQSKEIKKKNYFIEKISRFRPIAFVLKNKYVFILLTLFFFSYFLGFWNIKKYELVSEEISIPTVLQKDIDLYIKKEILGKNFFSFSSSQIERNIYLKFNYIKKINVEKSVPNRISVSLEVYEKEYVAYLGDKSCYLLSSDGYMLENLCKEDVMSCCDKYSTDNSIKYFVASTLNLSQDSNGRYRLLVIDNVSKLVSVFEYLSLEISDMSLEDNLLNVKTQNDKLFVFDFHDDLNLQLQRLLAIIGKVQGDDMEFKIIDLRFERPVLKK